ncbi:PREDICTED: prospero homeobox protein 2 [Nestor notabilis]|uniref:prospero homeobox protein 2 n=1 Tax=Nestor notabilis TaxID=176057 RepID=UPI000523F0A4|nr:PREDICTED: prospero homeobox protein 2 [Nestor notabilis]
MDGRTGPEQDSNCATSGYGQRLKLEPCFQSDSLLPSPSTPLIPQLLSHPMGGRSLDPTILFPSSQAVALPQEHECGASPGEGVQALAFHRTCVPAPVPCAGNRDQLSDQHLWDQLSNQHLQAKRARVESIIQGMSLSPTPQAFGTSLEAAFGHERERGHEMPWESKRKPRVPQQGTGAAKQVAPSGGSLNAEGCRQLKEQLCFLEQQLRRLQEKFSQVCNSVDTTQTEEGSKKAHPLLGKPGNRLDKDSATASSDPRKVPLWRSILEVQGPEEDKDRDDTGGLSLVAGALSHALKHELAEAMSWVVDSVLKTAWPKAASHFLQHHRRLPVPGPDARREHFAAGKCRKPLAKPSPRNTLGSPQAEAPSGAPAKSLGSHAVSFSSKGVRKSSQAPSMSLAAPIQDSHLLSQLLRYGQHSLWGSSSCRNPSSLERGPLEPLNLHWGTVKLRSSVMRQQQPLSPAGMGLALLPAGRDGCGELQAAMDGAPFTSTHISFGGSWRGPWAWTCSPCPLNPELSTATAGLPRAKVPAAPQGAKMGQMQEVLTPGHLKKAKLMFFFTRYPSSTLLKTYFLDVQFSRCITSQLIKWFSNFREFYYIQVEKFARQALLEGVVDAGTLRVSRDSELFRALNMHYNKGNDFEVPGRFLEVASLTLQEFFSAVKAGKDADPSWKKPIYKIISKLDSDIPEGFKAVRCSQELLRS